MFRLDAPLTVQLRAVPEPLVIVAAVFAFGGSLKGLFSTMATKMSSAAAKATS